MKVVVASSSAKPFIIYPKDLLVGCFTSAFVIALFLFLLFSSPDAYAPLRVHDITQNNNSTSGVPRRERSDFEFNIVDFFRHDWLSNGDHLDMLNYLENRKNVTSSSNHSIFPPTTVNDVYHHLKSHKNQGVIVDFTPHLKMLHHQDYSFPSFVPRSHWEYICNNMLHMKQKWIMCQNPHKEWNDWLPATTTDLTTAIYDAFIDNGNYCNPLVPGTIFTPFHTYHFQRWTTSDCYNDSITIRNYSRRGLKHFPEILNAVYSYGSSPGHFLPIVLPKLLRLILLCPITSKILIVRGRLVESIMNFLMQLRFFSPDRIVYYDQNMIYHADVVYRTESYPYLSSEKYNYYSYSKSDMILTHSLMTHHLLRTLPAPPNLIIVLVRKGVRSLFGMKDFTNYLENSLSGKNINLSAHYSLITLDPQEDTFEQDLKLFYQCKVLIGVHGAALSNLIWMRAEGIVLEIGYDRGMIDDLYAQMSFNSNLKYSLIMGQGSYYEDDIRVNYTEFEMIWKKTLLHL
jgi:Glycosyltransferase 61